jgi:hypothetical protein
MLCKHKALNSNPSPNKRKKKRKRGKKNVEGIAQSGIICLPIKHKTWGLITSTAKQN